MAMHAFIVHQDRVKSTTGHFVFVLISHTYSSRMCSSHAAVVVCYGGATIGSTCMHNDSRLAS